MSSDFRGVPYIEARVSHSHATTELNHEHSLLLHRKYPATVWMKIAHLVL